MLFPFEVDMDTCEILFTSQDSIVLLFIYIPIDGMEAKIMSSRENNPTFLRGKLASIGCILTTDIYVEWGPGSLIRD